MLPVKQSENKYIHTPKPISQKVLEGDDDYDLPFLKRVIPFGPEVD